LPPESGYCVKAELAPFVNLLVASEGEAVCLRGSTNGASASRCLLSECSAPRSHTRRGEGDEGR
jgi:hypothetical protein